DNAALLCGHHHTLVHTRRLHGKVDPTTGHVVWDLTRGSYDHALTTALAVARAGSRGDRSECDPPDKPDKQLTLGLEPATEPDPPPERR
ncbi:MAG: hypothetical protein ABI269_10115, partial [Lapillicoccus sp.]